MTMQRSPVHARDQDTLSSTALTGEADSTELSTQFDATHPVTHRPDRAYGNAEDPALTAFVMSLWDDLHSRRSEPVPPCPHCSSGATRLHNRPNRHHVLPVFACRSCKRKYSRLTGTPLARLRFAEKMPRFIALLSQPIPLEEASRRLDVDYMALSNWLMRFRELIAQHDPDGRWTTRVQLGIKYQPEGTCPHCHYTGVLFNGGFGSNERRRALCPQCGRGWPIGSDGQAASVAARVVRDPALTAVERRRRVGLGAPELPAISRAVLNVPPRAMLSAIEAPAIPAPQASRFDFSQPLRSNRPIPRSHTEDRQLTEFLAAEIGKVFSDSTAAPCCPHCAGNDTRLRVRPRTPSVLPEFQCRSCARCFTRATRTPMANMLRRDMLFAFLPWLSQHRPLAHAAAELGTKPGVVKAWVKRFRQWLLVLDPSGQYEQRVRLGLKTPWPLLPCPHCGEEAPARPHGFRPTRTQPVAAPARRLFRCSACNGFFDTAGASRGGGN